MSLATMTMADFPIVNENVAPLLGATFAIWRFAESRNANLNWGGAKGI